MSAECAPPQEDRWHPGDVVERWEAFTPDEREALMRFGFKPAPWETTPDTAERILKADPRVSLKNVTALMAIFRAAYKEMVTS